jgi:chromosome segregation ATPase
MPIPPPPVPEQSSARVSAGPPLTGRDVDQTRIASKSPANSKSQLAKYRDALNGACIARLDLGQKYNDLQRQCRSLHLDMEKTTNDHLSRLDEETLRNDILGFQLELAQTEAAEHRDTIKIITKKIKEASEYKTTLVGTIQQMESKLAEKDAELATLADQIAGRDSIIERFEETCDLLRSNLGKSNEAKRQKIAGLKATISSQFEVILSLSSDLEVQKQIMTEHLNQIEREKAAAISDREATQREFQTLKAAHEAQESYLNKLRQENESLEGDVEALIDMSIQSEAIEGEYIKENKRLTEQAAKLTRDMDLIRGALMDHLSSLEPDLSNLSVVLSSRPVNRRNPRRRCRNDGP